MSGRARLTVCAAAAPMMAACALLPLTDAGGWIFRALLLVCLQSGIGAAARRVPLARPLTVLVQALVSLIVLTMMFASHQAVGGILPGPTALRQLGLLVRDGMSDVGNFAIPAPVTPGTRAALFRVLAEQPGITSKGRAADALGRTGVVLSTTAPGDESTQGDVEFRMIIDEGTAELLQIEVRDQRPIALLTQAFEQTGWVDRLGERPQR